MASNLNMNLNRKSSFIVLLLKNTTGILHLLTIKNSLQKQTNNPAIYIFKNRIDDP